MPRTLVVDLSLRLGGASMRALNLLEAMPPGRALLAGIAGGDVLARAAERGVRAVSVGTSKSDPRIIGRLADVIRAEGIEVIDTHNPQSKLWGTLAARRTGIALVSTLNSWYFNEHEGRMRGHLYQSIESLTTPRTDRFIAVSKDIDRELQQAGVSAERIALIPNAVTLDPADYPALPARIAALPGITPRTRLIVAVGRLVEAKGYPHLIDAAAALPADSAVIIIGEGHLRPDLEARITQCGISDRVHLVGFMSREDLLGVVRAAAVFAMPSRTEGTPVALLEAAALGVPVVASRVGGIPELISNGVHGLLVPPADDAELAAALNRLLDNPREARQLATEAQARVQAEFSLEAQLSATLEAYQRAADRRQSSQGR